MNKHYNSNLVLAFETAREAGLSKEAWWFNGTRHYIYLWGPTRRGARFVSYVIGVYLPSWKTELLPQ